MIGIPHIKRLQKASRLINNNNNNLLIFVFIHKQKEKKNVYQKTWDQIFYSSIFVFTPWHPCNSRYLLQRINISVNYKTIFEVTDKDIINYSICMQTRVRRHIIYPTEFILKVNFFCPKLWTAYPITNYLITLIMATTSTNGLLTVYVAWIKRKLAMSFLNRINECAPRQ